MSGRMRCRVTSSGRMKVCFKMTDNAVTEAAGRFVNEEIKMDVSKRIMRNLEPARPLRRLNINQVPQSNAEIKPFTKGKEKPRECLLPSNCFFCGQDNNIKVEQLYKILHLQSTSTQPIKKDRICYSRDFLIKMASCPVAKKKPEFLPEHPVVLENGRTSDVPRLFVGNCYKNEDMFA
ncbi:uncharacterized protein C8orf88-like isoform X1 [Myxocyprinus asiaticus]|uniref:uncharacterized protein C8orf88-like isoform X1 n=1 Tax=Myxocyprinus asiaticus TaxID=70543 RepID=UPI0022219161|nr:uncharacterized protein C8orf88-like isoform X1 [Myxocyprinus asiaticus]